MVARPSPCTSTTRNARPRSYWAKGSVCCPKPTFRVNIERDRPAFCPACSRLTAPLVLLTQTSDARPGRFSIAPQSSQLFHRAWSHHRSCGRGNSRRTNPFQREGEGGARCYSDDNTSTDG